MARTTPPHGAHHPSRGALRAPIRPAASPGGRRPPWPRPAAPATRRSASWRGPRCCPMARPPTPRARSRRSGVQRVRAALRLTLSELPVVAGRLAITDAGRCRRCGCGPRRRRSLVGLGIRAAVDGQEVATPAAIPVATAPPPVAAPAPSSTTAPPRAAPTPSPAPTPTQRGPTTGCAAQHRRPARTAPHTAPLGRSMRSAARRPRVAPYYEHGRRRRAPG